MTCSLGAQESGFAGPQPLTFPTVSGIALNRTKLNLPRDFSAPLNLLILTFARNQQSAVESWLPVPNGISAAHPQIQSWVLPVSAKGNTLYRWWLDSSMRSSLPAEEPQQFTVPLYVDKARFQRALYITSEKQAVILLTDKDGHVMWRSVGSANDAKKASLAAFLKTLSP